MQRINLYQFSPKSKPPTKTNLLYGWFKKEISIRSIAPIDVFEVTKQGPVNGSLKNKKFAIQIFRGTQYLKKSFEKFKKHL
jgi:hypothetical protein